MNRFEKLSDQTRQAIVPLGILALCLSAPLLRAQQNASATSELTRNIDEPGVNLSALIPIERKQ